VVTGKAFLTAALACGAAAAIGAPASAQPANAAAAADTRAQDRATNEKMLAALLQRRAAILSTHSKNKRSALRFVDRQIARVRADLRN
jgi:hypothetical protein